MDVASSIQTVRTVDECQFKRGVTLPVQLAPDLSLRADADARSQVWTNLVQNTIQAMEGSGRLWVTAGLLQGRGVRVVVGNDGPPIPPDILARIFEAFFTTRAAGEGSGLGSRVSGWTSCAGPCTTTAGGSRSAPLRLHLNSRWPSSPNPRPDERDTGLPGDR